MALSSYYKTLRDPKKEFKERVKEICDISDKTFYSWVNGNIKKIPLPSKEKISEITGIPIDHL